MAGVTTRMARDNEAEALTELALRSKASWGYSPEFMAACREDLTFSPERMAAWRIWVAEAEGAVAGVIALRMEGGQAELEVFFVDPPFQGRGVGAALIAVFLQACRERGIATVGVDADPNAEPIYARFGFRTVGRSPSSAIAGRTLPRMALTLD
ncbi:MAG: GNAT family N-acetyltransferase [Phenylobacterium sp.]